ncbi:uracil-DNA glycosylase-like protein [Podospora fimiseda]|uniref:Uracil-DNA glycosylase-like protein n=1 Tax=Podospora fimiseda TaxID=252190 RepID=A0AAN7GYK6_9PEZI|nr:uracil-DNA glycosylase-like protein [Podospora fimiseda]
MTSQSQEENNNNNNDNDVSPKPPTFQGRLNLTSFMFTPKSTSTPGPPRLHSTPSETPPPPQPSQTPSKPPPKRKAPSSSTSSPRKRPSTPSSYAPPSKYAHMPLLPDAITPNLLVLFVGLNPGILTSSTGHAYAHPTNLFWRLLHSSGITPRLCSPTEDRQMPELYSLGLTNIVARPTKNGAELSKKEMDDGVSILEEKVRTNKPEVVCVVGKSIWESLWRVKHGKAIKKEEFRYGWQVGKEEYMGQSEEWKGARVFVASSTSGLAATLKPAEKEAIWKELGDWVVERRKEREEEEVKEEQG